jgi:hypothetical protein
LFGWPLIDFSKPSGLFFLCINTATIELACFSVIALYNQSIATLKQQRLAQLTLLNGLVLNHGWSSNCFSRRGGQEGGPWQSRAQLCLQFYA